MIRDFLLALGYFTRIPVPDHPNFSEAALKRSAVYFPLVGLLVGALLALVSFIALQFWPPMVAVLLTMAAGFLITGGFHEDGWADTFDGFGGAFERERKLAIMTDSRLGTYGSLALWGLLTLKAVALAELIVTQGVLIFLVLHSLSRWGAMSAMVWLDYAKTETSKAKPVVQQLTVWRFLLSGLFIVPTLLLMSPAVSLILLGTTAALAGLWIYLCHRQIGGYTGDTLGAAQQGLELGLIVVWTAL